MGRRRRVPLEVPPPRTGEAGDPWRASGGLAPRALVRRQVAIAGRSQFCGVEVVYLDRVQGQFAQLLELGALLGRDPAFAHALVELACEVQRLDRAVL